MLRNNVQFETHPPVEERPMQKAFPYQRITKLDQIKVVLKFYYVVFVNIKMVLMVLFHEYMH